MSSSPNPLRYFEGIVTCEVDNYLYKLLPERDATFAAMEQYAAKHDTPIVGPAVGRMLYLIARIAGAKRVFEMGSAIGYSTLWWAHAVGVGGRVVYTDSDPQNANRARQSFEQAGLAERIEIKVGDSLELLAREAEPYDIVFNDVDKQAYPRVLEMAATHVRKGGLYIVDNVLWSGRVTRLAEGDASTVAIQTHNDQLARSNQWFSSFIPLRDGVAVAIRE